MLMLATMLQLGTRHYGFLGIDGFIGIVIGLVVFSLLAFIVYQLLNALMGLWPAATEPMKNVVRWLVILLMFLFFLHFLGLY